jgi:AcrR family transcriptional regulator
MPVSPRSSSRRGGAAQGRGQGHGRSQAESRRRREPGDKEQPGILAERILEAARQSFATEGWAGTSMRAVARAADVDPALVHYYFADKEALLEASLTPPTAFIEQVAGAAASPIDQRGEACIRAVVSAWRDEHTATVMRSLLLTASHVPQAMDVLRNVISQVLVGVTAEGLSGEDRLLRATAVTSQMVGLAMLRYVWEIEPLASLPEEDLVDLIGPNIQRYLNQPPGSAGSGRTRKRPPASAS